jgi:3-hydroxyacyl-[acyl-carrier-protein] dehydratase
MIEGMAQTAGILVGEARDFKEKVILAKIQKAAFDGLARPGDQLKYEATIDHIDDRGAMTTGSVYRNDQPFGQVNIFFSHIDQNMQGLDFPEENFVFTENFMHLLKTYQSDLVSKQ